MTSRLHALSWPMRTERLLLRPAETRDVEPTWRIRRHEEVGRWITWAARDLDGYRAAFEEPERFGKTLVYELDGEVVGDLMVAVEDAWSQGEVADLAKGVQAEIGYCLDPAHQGHGYATEAVREVLRVCFEDLGLRRVTASCFADNVSSWRLMERLGMRREVHTVRESLHRSGEWLDGLGYALLADEWRPNG